MLCDSLTELNIVMKHLLKSVLLITFSVISFEVFAQIKPESFQRINVMKILDTIDSLNHAIQSEHDAKEINLPQRFQQIEILGDVTLYLTNETQNKLKLEGNPEDLTHVNVNVAAGTLTVNASKKVKSKLIIYVPVAGVSSLVVEGDSEIFSSGIVKTDALQIVLYGTSIVSVKYNGKLDVIAEGSSELIDIKDYEKIVSR